MKMALQISIVETAANQENRCSALQASVYSAKSPTTFVDGVSSGKSRIERFGKRGIRKGEDHGWVLAKPC